MPKLFYTNYTNVSRYRPGPPTCWCWTLSEKQLLNEFLKFMCVTNSDCCLLLELGSVFNRIGPRSWHATASVAGGMLYLRTLQQVTFNAQQTQNQKPNCANCDWLCSSWNLCCEMVHYQAVSDLQPLDTRGMCPTFNQHTSPQEVRQLSAMKTNKISFWCFLLVLLYLEMELFYMDRADNIVNKWWKMGVLLMCFSCMSLIYTYIHTPIQRWKTLL
jgi:hypothetical protein